MDVTVGEVGPPFDPREQSLQPGSVSMDDVARSAGPVFEAGPRLGGEHGHKIFGVGEEEDVGLLGVTVLRQAAVGAPGDRRKAQCPAEAERAVAQTTVVCEAEAGTEAIPTGADGERNGEAARSGDGVRPDLLANAADRPASLGKGQSRLGGGCVIRHRVCHEAARIAVRSPLMRGIRGIGNTSNP